MPIHHGMSDLSQLLGDLYADETPTKAPSWSSDEALDDAFSSWVPGPSDDAPSAERSIVADSWAEQPVEAPEAETWLAETAPAVEPVAALRWSPSHDDILPARRGRGFRLRLR
jgi:hypothetical protein